MSAKHLLVAYLILLSQLLGAQNLGLQKLINDSWHNSGKWFQKESYGSRDAWYWTLGGLGVGGLMLIDAETQASLQIADPNLKKGLSNFSEPFGNPYWMGALGLSTYLGASLSGQEELQNVSSTALQAMLTGGVAVMSLKLLFHRVRPEEQVILDPYQFNGPGIAKENLSFPSGHSTIAFALASSISAYYDDRLYLALPLYAMASLTAWQRVYQQKHWPSDVLMGALLGTFIGRKVARWQKEAVLQLSLCPLPHSNAATALRVVYHLD